MEMVAANLVAEMSLEEKASLCSGKGWWHTKAVERLGLDSIMMTDGPHGLRKELIGNTRDTIGIAESTSATCFPAASATAASFDRELLRELGEALADEAIDQGVSVVLGPGVNIKRSPLCVRNFEYFSEDPYLAGELGAAMIQGVQGKGIGVSLKHFAANNQEKNRMISDSVVDERALREIYLEAFRRCVVQAKPWTVMCSYNKVNGTYASQNRVLLTDILRGEWDFQGTVISDWGAVDNRVAGVSAGLDLQMPGSEFSDADIVAAAKSGRLPIDALDAAATRVVDLVLTALAHEQKRAHRYIGKHSSDADSPTQAKELAAAHAALYANHHELARKIAANSAVLLKNEDNILPLRDRDQQIAIIGAMAKTPRYQGAGSSQINPTQVDDAFAEFANAGMRIRYAPGYSLERGATPDPKLISEAVTLAEKSDVAVVFAGLPAEYESEGYDRKSLDLPEAHNQLIAQVAQANANTIVVLQTGSPVLMGWLNQVKAVLLSYLGGQAVGGAIVDVLTGVVNPSGKLPETFPASLRDTPSYLYFASMAQTEEYRESLYTGYRFYDTAEIPVLFNFGYGLSYTTFSYGELRVSGSIDAPDYEIHCSLEVTNTGPRAGAEVVQLYLSGPNSDLVFRPAKELKGFAKVFLEPGETKTVDFTLGRHEFCYFNMATGDWALESGEYRLLAGASIADIRSRASLELTGDGTETELAALASRTHGYFDIASLSKGTGLLQVPANQFEALLGRPLPPRHRNPKAPFDRNSTLRELRRTPAGQLISRFLGKSGSGEADLMTQAQLQELPLRALANMSDGRFTPHMMDALLAVANRRYLHLAKSLFGLAKSLKK